MEMTPETTILYGITVPRKKTALLPTYQGLITWQQLRQTSILTAERRSYHMISGCPEQPGTKTLDLACNFLDDLFHCFEIEPRQISLRPRRSGLTAVRNDPWEHYRLSATSERIAPELLLPLESLDAVRRPGPIRMQLAGRSCDWVQALNLVGSLFSLQRRTTPLSRTSG